MIYQEKKALIFLQITCPITLWYSDNDWAASEEDVALIKTKIGKRAAFKQVPHENFGHLDFLWDDRITKGFYDDLLADLML